MLVAVVLLALAGPALAQGDRAEAMIVEGVKLRRAHDDEGALRLFREAYALAPTPRAAAQMGLAEQALKRWVDAARHLGEALRATSDPWVAQYRTVLSESLRTVSKEVGQIEVGGEPEGAEVRVNGEPRGRVPALEAIPVNPGSVHIEVRKPGYLPSTLSVTVAAGQRSRIDVRLPLDPAVVTLKNDDQKDSREPVSHGSGLRTARWVAAGAGVLFLAAGITGVVIHDRKIGQFNQAGCMRDPTTGAIRVGNVDTCSSLIETADAGKYTGIVGFAGAGLLAITSGILYFAF